MVKVGPLEHGQRCHASHARDGEVGKNDYRVCSWMQIVFPRIIRKHFHSSEPRTRFRRKPTFVLFHTTARELDERTARAIGVSHRPVSRERALGHEEYVVRVSLSPPHARRPRFKFDSAELSKNAGRGCLITVFACLYEKSWLIRAANRMERLV